MASENTELRASQRYPLKFDVEYRVFGKGHSIIAGTARTLNISSHGVLLAPTEGASKGQFIELSISWNSGAPEAQKVELEVLGRVIRVDSRGTAVHILRYGFLTQAAPTPLTTIVH